MLDKLLLKLLKMDDINFIELTNMYLEGGLDGFYKTIDKLGPSVKQYVKMSSSLDQVIVQDEYLLSYINRQRVIGLTIGCLAERNRQNKRMEPSIN